MNIEFEIETERVDTLIVSVQPEAEYPWFLGKKVFKNIGEFKYEWLIEYINLEEIDAIIDTLTASRDYYMRTFVKPEVSA